METLPCTRTGSDMAKHAHARIFAAFRHSHPPRHRMIDGVSWSYIAAGNGDEIVVLLPGALGVADTAFHYVLAFAPRYRVLSLDYPPAITNAVTLLAGIAALLATETSDPVHLVGGSYSGPVAHAFAQRYPGRVRSLVFSNTGLPRRVRLVTPLALVAAIALLPSTLAQWVMERMLHLWISSDEPIDHFWRTYFVTHLPHFTRRFLLSRARLLWLLSASGFASGITWRGPVLMVNALEDALFTAADQRRLLAAYPDAGQVVLGVTGHGSALKALHDHVAAYERFWTNECVAIQTKPAVVS